MSLAILQSAFAAALLDPEALVPAAVDGRGDDPARRFAVYRNNVAVSLVDALAERFPVCRRLVGEEFFRAMTRLYVAGSPPVSPLLMEYGDDFHAFIADFPPARDLPYLADVAYLEAARTRAFHAADAAPLDAGAFAALVPEDLPGCRVDLQPSMELLCSSWSIGTIWTSNAAEAEPGPLNADRPENVLVSRPGMKVAVEILSRDGDVAFMIALMNGASLGDAALNASAAAPAFDAAAGLTALIGRHVVTAIHPPGERNEP
jgi:hypothetical protein